MCVCIKSIHCCCCSVTQSCPTLCYLMDCSMPGLPVPHHLTEFAQVHVHCISDAIQPSHPLTPSSPSALNLSQHQGLFQWLSCSHQSTGELTHHQTVSGGKWWGQCAGRSGWHGETGGPLPSLRFPGGGLLGVLAAEKGQPSTTWHVFPS